MAAECSGALEQSLEVFEAQFDQTCRSVFADTHRGGPALIAEQSHLAEVLPGPECIDLYLPAILLDENIHLTVFDQVKAFAQLSLANHFLPGSKRSGFYPF